MNFLWMGLFACIISGEKMWSRGVLITRSHRGGLTGSGLSFVMGGTTLETNGKLL
jgi:hypothetical protein